MKSINSSTQLIIFSTLLINAVIFGMYIMLISSIDRDMAAKGLVYDYSFFKTETAVMFGISTVLAYAVSSIVIDRIMNPIRLMISKVNEIGNMNFSKPLVINSEDEVLREYVKAFNNMAQKLGGYIVRQKRFISDATHELVTPVTIINGHADLLIRYGGEHPDLLEDELNIIKSEALRMNSLIDSLLLLARSDSGKQTYTFTQVMLDRLIRDSVMEAEIIAPEYHFETAMDNGIKVLCDEDAIRRVIRIILSNAIKYSSDNRYIKIITGKSHGLIKISIKDNGIGIADDQIEKIFDRFYRVDTSRSKKTGGSGLGLAIAKDIIDAHGGEINVVSTFGEGTEFTIVLSE